LRQSAIGTLTIGLSLNPSIETTGLGTPVIHEAVSVISSAACSPIFRFSSFRISSGERSSRYPLDGAGHRCVERPLKSTLFPRLLATAAEERSMDWAAATCKLLK